ncbi:glutathione S-transferase T3 [Hordeum vulgare]|nr:glutathione S-transferase T3 [Hordeum vulgare]
MFAYVAYGVMSSSSLSLALASGDEVWKTLLASRRPWGAAMAVKSDRSSFPNKLAIWCRADLCRFVSAFIFSAIKGTEEKMGGVQPTGFLQGGGSSDDVNFGSTSSAVIRRGVDSHPSSGFLGFFKDAPCLSQAMSNDNSSQQFKEKDASNGGECTRTEKRLLWTKDEDLRLVGAWLNNSNDPIQSNYKKNDQYWKEVDVVYNSTTPKNRERLVKQVKDRFGTIKKRIAWFCGSYKEANALYASGESDTDLKKRAMQTYEADHKEDSPLMFEHCWEVLKDQPKWDAYLERL